MAHEKKTRANWRRLDSDPTEREHWLTMSTLVPWPPLASQINNQYGIFAPRRETQARGDTFRSTGLERILVSHASAFSSRLAPVSSFVALGYDFRSNTNVDLSVDGTYGVMAQATFAT